MKYTMNETSEGLELRCGDCGKTMPFTKHATVAGIQEAIAQHNRFHERAAVIRPLEGRLIALDNATVYLDFQRGDDGKETVLCGVTSLNPLGNAGAWRWKYEGQPGEAVWLREELMKRAERGSPQIAGSAGNGSGPHWRKEL
jgi:hypothetical protein